MKKVIFAISAALIFTAGYANAFGLSSIMSPEAKNKLNITAFVSAKKDNNYSDMCKLSDKIANYYSSVNDQKLTLTWVTTKVASCKKAGI
ncbi:hypothetical protein [Dongshaea marina]|uniref:hypothetical protein n=1 Tax=Dongshaea marina TaxID=2047966 RepID=UPI000D3E24CC|nr:hypothetical protein [Dongshaea marina]